MVRTMPTISMRPRPPLRPGVTASGSCMPRKTKTVPLMRNEMTRQKLSETSLCRAAVGEERRGAGRAMTSPAATTAKMPLTWRDSAKRYTRNGVSTS